MSGLRYLCLINSVVFCMVFGFATDAAAAQATDADDDKKVFQSGSLKGAAAGTQFSGNASWYGVPFHGRKTASGEIFDMYKCSAAHKTLPLITKVLVEDPRTGNVVLVRVNDRGPYVGTRVMDLSREAARRLGTMGRGVYFIEATVVGKES